MRIFTVILICLSVISCRLNQSDNSIQGKWAGALEGDYYELYIDSSEVHVFTSWFANGGTYKYYIEADSIFYPETGFAAKLSKLNDSAAVLIYDTEMDTLHKLNDRVISYDEIDPNDTIAFQIFIDDFYTRAKSYYKRSGGDYLENTDNRLNEAFQEEIFKIN